MEQRRERRFRATFPVEIEPDGGLTIDMSSTGIAFETTHDYQLGDEIKLRVMMGRRESVSPLDLHCTGTVVRIEKIDSGLRVGAKVDWLDAETSGTLPTIGF